MASTCQQAVPRYAYWRSTPSAVHSPKPPDGRVPLPQTLHIQPPVGYPIFTHPTAQTHLNVFPYPNAQTDPLPPTPSLVGGDYNENKELRVSTMCLELLCVLLCPTRSMHRTPADAGQLSTPDSQRLAWHCIDAGAFDAVLLFWSAAVTNAWEWEQRLCVRVVAMLMDSAEMALGAIPWVGYACHQKGGHLGRELLALVADHLRAPQVAFLRAGGTQLLVDLLRRKTADGTQSSEESSAAVAHDWRLELDTVSTASFALSSRPLPSCGS